MPRIINGIENNNCDGSGPHNPISNETRVLPTSNGSNAILCEACFDRELEWRKERNKKLNVVAQFDLPLWQSLTVHSRNSVHTRDDDPCPGSVSKVHSWRDSGGCRCHQGCRNCSAQRAKLVPKKRRAGY